MSAKTEILARIRRNLPQAAPLPEMNETWISYPNREAQFLEVLAAVGGKGIVVPRGTSMEAVVRELPCMNGAQQIISTVANVPVGNVELNSFDDPHALENIDVAILPGEFAVAENSAVWVTDKQVKHRVLYFITQHLVLVVPRREIVNHLHEAYERISFDSPGYGLFIAGPSKTADIEQSLVIGAHGPRSLTVLLVED